MFSNSQPVNLLDSERRHPGPRAGHRIRISGPQPWAGSLSLRLGKGGRGHEDGLTSNLTLVPSSPCSRMAMFGPQGPPQLGQSGHQKTEQETWWQARPLK